MGAPLHVPLREIESFDRLFGVGFEPWELEIISAVDSEVVSVLVELMKEREKEDKGGSS